MYDDGLSPLHVAAECGTVQVCNLLIANGADVNLIESQEHCYRSPLHFAAVAGEAAVCECLVPRGAHIDATERHCATPLWEAAYLGHLSVCQVLVSLGAAMASMSVLSAACSQGMVDVCAFLLYNGADLNGKGC